MRTIHQAIQALDSQRSLPQGLIAAYRGLEIVEYATRQLVFLDPVVTAPRWREPQRLAACARGVLAQAPSIPWPLQLPPPVLALGDEDEEVVEAALFGLVDVLVIALVETTAKASEPADRVACHASVTRVGALQQAFTHPDLPHPLSISGD